MRAFLATLTLAGFLAVALMGPPAGALISLPSIKNRLIQLALDQVSSPGSFEIAAEEIEDLEGGVTSLVGVSISDGEGVWLTLERLNFAWEPGKLVGGELSITQLRLIGLDVSRPPSAEAEPPQLEPQEPWQQGPFDWPRAPISVTVEGFTMENAFVAEGVLPQAIRFDAEGRALDKGDLQEVALSLRRIDDVEGRIDFLLRRDFAAGTLRLDLTADEAAGGLVAAAAGLPDDAAASLALNAAGPVDDWRLTFDAAAERVLEAGGEATFDYSDRLNVVADFTVTPGPEIGPELAAVLGERARLQAEIIEQPDGMIEVVAGELASPALQASASGALATGPTGESDLAVSLVALAPLGDLVEGVGFERFSFDGQVTGPQGALAAEGRIGLRALTTAPVDIGDLALEGRVAQTEDGVDFDLGGRGERLRLDRIGADVIGAARLEAVGDLSGDLLTLQRAVLDSNALTVEADGGYDLAASSGELDISLSAPEIAPVAGAYGVEAEGQVAASAGIGLEGERVAADFSASLERFEMDVAGAGRLALSGTVSSDPERLAFDVTGEGERLRIDRLGPEVIGTARLAAAGELAGDLLTLREAALRSQALTAEASGTYDIAAGAGDLAVQLSAPEIAPVAGAYDVAVEGGITASAEVALGPESVAANLTARLERFAMEGVAAARSLTLAGRVAQEPERIAFDVAGEGAGLSVEGVPQDLTRELEYAARGALAGSRLTLAAARLTTPAATAEASGDVALDEGRMALDYALQSEDLAALAGAFGVDVSGALDAEGRAEGPFDAPRIDGEARLTGAAYGGQDYGRVTVDHDVAVAPAPEGRVAVALDGSWLGDGTAATRFRLEGNTLALADLEARLLGARAAGRADIALDGPLVDGAFDVSVSDLRPLGRFAGTPLAGAASGRVTLSTAGGRQDARATLEATNLAAGDATVESLGLTLSAADVLGAPRVDVNAEAGGATAGPVALEALTATAQGPLAALDFSAEARGTLRNEPLEAGLAGRANAAASPMRVTLARAEVAAGEDTLRLEAPLELRLGGGVVAAEGLALALPGDGRLAGDAALRPGGFTGDVTLERLALADVARWTGAGVTGGRVDATATFDTRPGRARADLSLRAREVTSEAAGTTANPVDLDLEGQWDGRRLDGRAEARGGFGEPFRASFALPLRPGAGGVPTVPADGELQGSVAWQGRIGDLWALVPAPGHLLDGQAVIDLAIAGTVAEPRVSGRAEVTDGQYQNLDAGTILTGLTLDTRVVEGRTVEVTLEANDGASGTVRADAAIRLGDGPVSLDLTADVDRAVLLRRDDVTAAISGQVALEGPLADMALTGELTVDEAEVRLVNATPPEVVVLDGIRMKGEPPVDRDAAGESIVSLDISIVAERDIFVRGRGLDSEWGMDLRVGGTATRPIVTGTIERVRGQLSLLGKVFALERGRVVFDGGRTIDPQLDVYLEREDHGIRGGIVVEGRASDPELSFTSSPALPESEVMPRLLFGQSRQSLTGGQAIQLGAGIARLMGGGSGPLDTIRETVGLDVLRVGGESVEEAEVTVGRNIGEDIFIGAEQKLGGQGTAVTVEVEVFEGVTVDTEVGQDGRSNIGITLKKDF